MKNYKKKLYTFLLLLTGLISLCASPALAYENIDSNSIAAQLGWVQQPYSNQICPGYYQQPYLGQVLAPIKSSETAVSADSVTYSRTGNIVLHGNVIVNQPGRRLTADRAVLHRNPKTGKFREIDLYGNIHILTVGKLILGKKATLYPQRKTGHIEKVHYRVILADDNQVPLVIDKINPNTVRLVGLAGYGSASSAIQFEPGHTEFKHATYTTCAPTANQWRLRATRIYLNKKSGRGTAHNVRLYVSHVPIFWLPYINFPINNKRKTGFLFPIIGYSNVSGYEFGLPFYWNIAPNYDALFTPVYYSKRGILFHNRFRYLTLHHEGQFNVSFISNDQEFKRFQNKARNTFIQQTLKHQSNPAKFPAPTKPFGFRSTLNAPDTRYYLHWRDFGRYGQHWTSYINYNYVSDAYYFQDFGTVASLVSQNQLEQIGQVNYQDQFWTMRAIMSGYQTLHAINRQPVQNQYSRLPEIDLDSHYPNFGHNFNVGISTQGVYFDRSIGPGDTTFPPDAVRIDTTPHISMENNWSWGFFIPTLQFDATMYNIHFFNPNNSMINPFTPQAPLPFVNQNNGAINPNIMPVLPPLPPNVNVNENINRSLPLFDIDTGLYFVRNLTIGDTPYVQTLEPRVYYLYVPFRNQNNIPIFDAATIPFSYDQMFRTNRFSGTDRIGDANQVTLALTTKFNNDNTGNQKFAAGIGEIFYFENRRVTICRPQPGKKTCSDTNTQIGATSNTEPTSPIAGFITYNFNPAWSFNGNIAWDPHVRKMINTSAFFQFRPNSDYLFNIGYNFLRNGDSLAGAKAGSSKNDLDLISTSGAFQLTPRISVLGLINYNISHSHIQTYFAGLQYNTCCWAVRFVGGRTFTALNENGKPQFTNAVYFQFILKGLANIDPANLGSLLTAQIPGYADPLAESKSLI